MVEEDGIVLAILFQVLFRLQLQTLWIDRITGFAASHLEVLNIRAVRLQWFLLGVRPTYWRLKLATLFYVLLADLL